MAETETDRELLKRVIDCGDRAALDMLVRRYIHFVYATARRELGGDAHEADDVTQAVFLVLARRAASVPPRRIGGWLFRVVRYAAADARKRAVRRVHHERQAARQRSEVLPMSSQTLSAAGSEPNPLLPLLNDAMASLGASDREALILRYFRGAEMAAVASALDVSEIAARKRVTRAVEKLRRFYGARGVEPAVASVLTLAAAERAPAATVAATAAALADSATAGAESVQLAGEVTGRMLWAGARRAAALTVAVLAAVFCIVQLARQASSDAPRAASPVRSAATVPVGSPTPTLPTPSDDRAAMQGIWRMTRAEHDGQAVPAPQLATWEVVVQEDEMRFALGTQGTQRITFKLDPSKQPKWIDITPADYPETMRGIYQLRGDELWIAQWNQRPVAFQSTPRGVLYVLRRNGRPASAPAATAP